MCSCLYYIVDDVVVVLVVIRNSHLCILSLSHVFRFRMQRHKCTKSYLDEAKDSNFRAWEACAIVGVVTDDGQWVSPDPSGEFPVSGWTMTTVAPRAICHLLHTWSIQFSFAFEFYGEIFTQLPICEHHCSFMLLRKVIVTTFTSQLTVSYSWIWDNCCLPHFLVDA